MKWLLAGLLFALAVAQAIGTAALRAENLRLRHDLALLQAELQDRAIERNRLLLERLAAGQPAQLAAAQWALLRGELQRRQGAAP